MLFIRTKYNMQIFRVIHFIKLQNDTSLFQIVLDMGTLTHCWSCVGSGLPMDVCDFTSHEKRKGHKQDTKGTQAVNSSLSIFLCVPFLELKMQ